MNSHRIIALYADAPGSGKSTVAKFITEMAGGQIMPFAASMREMLKPLAKRLGLNEHGFAQYFCTPEGKAQPIFPLSVTPRDMLQTLGTEWGRNCIDQKLWLYAWLGGLATIPTTELVIVDDLRFRNEAEFLRDLGAFIVKVDRPSIPQSPASHSSEGGLRDWTPTLQVINSTLPTLRKQVEIMLDRFNEMP